MNHAQGDRVGHVRRTVGACALVVVAFAPATCKHDWTQLESQDGGGAANSTTSGEAYMPPGGCGSSQAACDKACTDLQTDPAHCGACDRACSSGRACVAGACQCFVGEVAQIASPLPQNIAQSLVSTQDIYAVSCGGVGAGDRIYQFTAAAAGSYSFEIVQPGYNSALALLDASTCQEVLCNSKPATGGGTAQGASGSIDLEQGASVYAVVSSLDESRGSFSLKVTEGRIAECSPSNMASTSFPVIVAGNTSFLTDTGTPSCLVGSLGSPDAMYRFTAPADNDYIFDTNGSRFDTALEILDGDCHGASLGCARAGGGGQPSLKVPLRAGSSVVVWVDGMEGASGGYTLNVSLPPTPCTGAAIAGPLPLVVQGSIVDLPDRVRSSCGSDSFSGSDVDFHYTAPAAGTYNITVETTAFDSVLSIHENTCEGRELVCNDDNPDTSRSALSIDLTAGQLISIVVDSFEPPATGPFTLTISQ